MVVPDLLPEGGYRGTMVVVSDDVEGPVCWCWPSFVGGGREVFEFWVFFRSLTRGGGWLPNVVVGY